MGDQDWGLTAKMHGRTFVGVQMFKIFDWVMVVVTQVCMYFISGKVYLNKVHWGVGEKKASRTSTQIRKK